MRKKYQLYINGIPDEIFNTYEDAMREKNKQERKDAYDKSIGYKNPLPTYTIKEIIY